jgi:hypothetical protein
MFEIWSGRECHQLGSFIGLSAYESIITIVGCLKLRGSDVDDEGIDGDIDEGIDGGLDAPVSTWTRTPLYRRRVRRSCVDLTFCRSY